MAQQDKTDFYWNGVLSGAVNNLYYDLINVDVVHVPYATSHRNSSFFLKTRLGYTPETNWRKKIEGLEENWDVTDVHIVWDEKCSEQSGKVYILARDTSSGTAKRKIFIAYVENGCISNIKRVRFESDVYGCGERKLLVTDYVRGEVTGRDGALDFTSDQGTRGDEIAYGIQVNKIEGGKTIGQFQDEDTVAGYAKWSISEVPIGTYLLVYSSDNSEGSGFAGQVRMVTGVSSDGRSLELNAPWLGFTVPEEGEDKVSGGGLKYKFFSDWGEVVGFTNGKTIDLILDDDTSPHTIEIFKQEGISSTVTHIIGIASANDKIFVLTDNGYIHYSREGIGRDKFFFDEDMYAGVDKINLTAYRDIIIAFGRKHIALGVPDEQNRIWTMYNQSTSIGLWSRYSYNEYDGDLVFVSNDKRFLTLKIADTGRYGLTFVSDRPGVDRLNGKLSMLVEGDEVYIGSDNNDLKVFVNTKDNPFKRKDDDILINDVNNTETHIYKYDTLFQLWTEDHIPHFLLWGVKFGIYFGQYGLYTRGWNTEMENYVDTSAKYGGTTTKSQPVETRINAYMIENETNGLDNHPLLFQLAKLNRLITTLGPGVYTDTTKIKITTYSKGIGYTYEFPVNGDGNDWLGLMTSYYLDEGLDDEQEEKLECMLSTLQDSQKQYQPNCPDSKVLRQYHRSTRPWCDKYTELLTESHGVCINDKIYELAPTMPLVTSLGENQQYSTQIKIELIGGKGDIITFGGWLAELYLAPLGLTGPDGEYQLQPNTDCD